MDYMDTTKASAGLESLDSDSLLVVLHHSGARAHPLLRAASVRWRDALDDNPEAMSAALDSTRRMLMLLLGEGKQGTRAIIDPERFALATTSCQSGSRSPHMAPDREETLETRWSSLKGSLGLLMERGADPNLLVSLDHLGQNHPVLAAEARAFGSWGSRVAYDDSDDGHSDGSWSDQASITGTDRSGAAVSEKEATAAGPAGSHAPKSSAPWPIMMSGMLIATWNGDKNMLWHLIGVCGGKVSRHYVTLEPGRWDGGTLLMRVCEFGLRREGEDGEEMASLLVNCFQANSKAVDDHGHGAHLQREAAVLRSTGRPGRQGEVGSAYCSSTQRNAVSRKQVKQEPREQSRRDCHGIDDQEPQLF